MSKKEFSTDKETRIFDGNNHPEIRANENGKKYLFGYAVKFNQLSRSIGWGFREKFLPGAFDEVLNADFRQNIAFDTVCLFNHNYSQILGRRSAETLEIGVDDIGLFYNVEIPDTTVGKDLQISVERRDVPFSSFSFSAAADGVGWEEDETFGEIRVVSKAKYLYDVSPVVDPAYAQSTVEVAQRDYNSWKDSKIEKPVSFKNRNHAERMKREIEIL